MSRSIRNKPPSRTKQDFLVMRVFLKRRHGAFPGEWLQRKRMIFILSYECVPSLQMGIRSRSQYCVVVNYNEFNTFSSKSLRLSQKTKAK